MASMLDQLLEGADRFLEEAMDKDDCVDCNIGDAIKDVNFNDLTSNAQIPGVSDNPGDLTVGPDVHQEVCGNGTDDAKSANKPVEEGKCGQGCCGKGTKCEGAEMDMDEQVQGLTESEMLTADELFNIYSEAVVEVLRESKKAITKKYTEKKDLAKKFKAKKLAEKSKSAKKQKLEEAAVSGNFNTVMEQILDAR